MRLLNKLYDWATNNSYDFQQEEDTYEIIIEEINTINNLIDEEIKRDESGKYAFNYRSGKMSLSSLQDYIQIKRKQLIYAKTKGDQNRINREIAEMQKDYLIFYEQLRDYLLQLKELYEIQKYVTKINGEIYQHANLETFYNFIQKDMLSKKWTMSELEKLRQAIAERREKIIPYLGKMQMKK